MLSREDFFMIKQRREQGAHIVDIAYELGCSERTVRRYLALPAPRTGRRPRRPSKLDAFKPFIDQQIAAEVWNAEVIYQQLRDQGYRGGRTLVRLYIQPKRALRASKQTVRYETEPGKQLQHDWGQIRTDLAGESRTVHFAVNVLGSSRCLHVWAAPREDAEHTYEALVRAFHHFGGVPRQVLVDNQKAAVVRHDRDGTVHFNAGFLDLAHHYGFQPKACRPQRPRTKGKTERMVGYVKQNFFQRYRHFESYGHLNRLLEEWLTTVANQRVLRQYQATPAQRWEQEKSALQALPATDFDTRYYDQRHVSWDAYIDVRGNRYSVPAEYCGQTVTVRLSLDDELTVYAATGQVIAQHRLCDRREGWRTEPTHHETLWQRVAPVQRRDLSVYEEILR